MARAGNTSTSVRATANSRTARNATPNLGPAQRFGNFLLDVGGRAFSAQSRDFYMLLGVTAILAVIGVIMVFSASYVDSLAAHSWAYTDGLHQLIFVIGGVCALTFFSLTKLAWVERIILPLYGFFIVVQLSVFVIGKEVNGNKNWIALPGGFSLQPSEFFKITLCLFLAWFISKNQQDIDDRNLWLKAGIMLAVPIAIIMAQKDMGTSIIIVAAYIGLAVLAGLPARLLTFTLLAASVLGFLALRVGSSTRWPRIMAWLFPNNPDPLDYNWQQNHGVWAIAAGRLTGVGLGNSKMKWSWIPEIQSDFIFAIIGEELGLIGCLVIIVLFVVLINTLIRISLRTKDLFSRLFVQGVATWLAAQSLINIAVVLDLLPVLGVPLPLISSGGSSMIATMSAIGIVLAVERDNQAGQAMGFVPQRPKFVAATRGRRA
ncbi:MAG: cell division protein FtsW [Actinomycetales bacterium]|nr:cell division protein FtsW [Actinomycetales bacterium]